MTFSTFSQIKKEQSPRLSDLGAELVFTQDSEGEYHSFYWDSNVIFLPSSNGNRQSPLLQPVNKSAYLERIQRVLNRRIPEQCHCLLGYQGQQLPFELVITPILSSQGNAELVLVMGHRLQEEAIALTSNSALPTNPDPFQQLLTQIARKIRRTLDLQTIWQQTVESIGSGLQVDRCLLLIPSGEENIVDVKAEYCVPSYESLLDISNNYFENQL